MKDLHKRWSHRWLNPKLEIRKSSIDGRGTFATNIIKQGEIIAVYGGIIVPREDIHKYRKEIGGIRGIQISENFFICPTESQGGLFNHSCEPNMGLKSQIEYVAIDDINKGQEVVTDYAFTELDFEEFTCQCKTDNCRKTIRPNDWEDKKIQNKYKEYYSPYLRDRIG